MLDGPARRAQLALLLEVASAPKPGNVDRERNLPDLTFAQFQAGILGAGPGLELAAAGEGIGHSFERAVTGMATAAGTNTSFGALLLLVPLVSAADAGVDRSALSTTIAGTTVDDARAFYRAVEAVDIAVGDPPAGREDLDVRRGTDAVPALESDDLSLADVVTLGAETDDIAREWATDFDRSFDMAERLAARTGPLTDRIASAYLVGLAARPDSLVATRHGADTASAVSERARTLLENGGLDDNRSAVQTFASDLVARGINPGTTADIVAAGLFIALERGTVQV